MSYDKNGQTRTFVRPLLEADSEVLKNCSLGPLCTEGHYTHSFERVKNGECERWSLYGGEFTEETESFSLTLLDFINDHETFCADCMPHLKTASAASGEGSMTLLEMENYRAEIFRTEIYLGTDLDIPLMALQRYNAYTQLLKSLEAIESHPFLEAFKKKTSEKYLLVPKPEWSDLSMAEELATRLFLESQAPQWVTGSPGLNLTSAHSQWVENAISALKASEGVVIAPRGLVNSTIRDIYPSDKELLFLPPVLYPILVADSVESSSSSAFMTEKQLTTEQKEIFLSLVKFSREVTPRDSIKNAYEAAVALT